MNRQQEFNARLSEDAEPRRQRIMALRESGLTFAQIAKLEGITRQRAFALYIRGKKQKLVYLDTLPHGLNDHPVPVIAVRDTREGE